MAPILYRYEFYRTRHSLFVRREQHGLSEHEGYSGHSDSTAYSMIITAIILASNFIHPTGFTCDDINGYYENKTVYICPYLPKELHRQTLVHEIAHYVWDLLSESKQEEWIAFDHPEDLWSYVSDYAGFNVYEDFAETFKYLYLGLDDYTENAILTAKKQFVREIIWKLKRNEPLWMV